MPEDLFLTLASRSNPHSTARSPRAIITPTRGLCSAASSSSGKRSKLSRVSIFRITPMSERPSLARRS
jgi:hypothetical protein